MATDVDKDFNAVVNQAVKVNEKIQRAVADIIKEEFGSVSEYSLIFALEGLTLSIVDVSKIFRGGDNPEFFEGFFERLKTDLNQALVAVPNVVN